MSGYYVDSQQALAVKNQYTQLGLIATTVNKNNEEVIELTKKGIEVMNNLNAFK